MKVTSVIAPLLVFGLGLVVGTALDASSPPAKPKVTTLLQTSLAQEFTPNREIMVDLVEIAPNGVLDRHWHPGEEFHYYLEGEVEIKMDGQPSIAGKPGVVGHIPFEKWHEAVAGKDGAKVLVFRVHTKGEPWRFIDE